MKLISCHIENFGTLKNKDYEFTDGLNAFIAKNGAGKSTLIAFVCTMFYGFDGDRKQSITENERKKYAPWQGGVYGGSLVFSARGKVYELTRIFNDKESNDVFSLRDAETNLPVEDFSTYIGEELFHVDRDSFLRTVLIRQNMSAFFEKDGKRVSIHAQNAITDDMNESLSGDASYADYGSFDNADQILKTWITQNGTRTKNSRASRIQSEITSLNTELKLSAGLPEELRTLENEKKHVEEEIDLCRYTLKKLSHAQKEAALSDSRAVKDKQLEALREDLRKKEQVYQKEKQSVDGELPTDSDFREMAKETKSSRRKVNVGIPIVVLSLLVFLSGGVYVGLKIFHGASFTNGIIIAAVGLVLFILGLIIHKSSVKQEKEPAGGDYDTIQLLDLQQKVMFIRHAEREYKEAKERLDAFVKEYGDMDNTYTSLATQKSSQEIRTETEETNEKLSSLYEELSSLNRRMELTAEKIDALEEKKVLLSEREAEKERLTRDLGTIKRTREVLTQAKMNIGARYSEPLLTAFKKYYTALTGESGEEFIIDASLHITIKESGIQHETVLLSEGYRDLAGLALRLAFTEAMFKEEIPFIILDDPFVNFDEEKTENAMHFLKEISASTQVLYFTCHKMRLP